MGKRSIRKFLTAPRKRHRWYGSAKRRYRPAQQPADHECHDSSGEWAGLLTTPEHITEVDVHPADGFLGFDTSPCSLRGGDAGLCVLSLFDGICGAYAALTRLGINIQSYYTAEIDDNCIKVQERHVPQAIQLGNVIHLTNATLERLGIVPHLLVGGSPCRDLSRVNPQRKGLWDHGGTGPLFFHYVRIKNFLQSQAEKTGRKFFWLFENTSCMDKSTLSAMVEAFGGLRPVPVSSVEFVPMRRSRFFWGNLGTLAAGRREQHKSSLILQDFLEPGRTALVKKLHTITTNPASQRGSDGRLPVRQANGKESYLRVTELESLFGFDRSWTDTGDLSLSARRQLLGRSFCVPVIASLLAELQFMEL